MPVPSSMAGLSTTDALNSPAGADPIGTGLDNYLRAIQSIIRTTNAKGADIASAATTDIGAATGEFVTVTGSTTITNLGTIDAGIVRTVHFSGAPLITHNATSLILPGNKNYQVAAGDVLQFRSLGSGNWRCVGISNPSNAGAVTFVDTLADLKTLSGIVNGALVTTKERSTGKGGGGTYEYDDSLAVFDEFVNVASTALSGGYILRDARKNILQAGADPTGASDSSAAFDRADIGENIYVPAGTYDFTSAVTCTVDGTLFYGDGGYASTITKSFNGIPLTFEGDSSGIVGIGIEGDGANFTGGGVKPKGYNNVVKMCRINDTADSCVLFDAAVGTNVGSGTYAVVEDNFLLPTNTSTTYSIRSIGTDDSTRPTVRTFRNISGGGPGPDFSGMNRAILADSFCTIIKFDANSSKIDIHNNRFTNAAANLTVYGSDHTIDNNIWGFGATYGITIDSTCANVHWGPNNPIVVGTSTLQSPTIGATIGGQQANNIHTDLIDYKNQFEWKGTTTDGTFGNSTYSAYYKLSGRHCYASFSLSRGSTATNATGTWQFRLPFEAFVTATGVALVKSSTGTYNPAVFEVQGGSSLAVLYLPASTAAMTDASIAFGTGGLIEATLNYLISPT